MSVPMIAITTRSSTSVKPAVRADMWGARRCMIGFLFSSTTLGHNSPPWATVRGEPHQGFPTTEDREGLGSSQRKESLRPPSKKAIQPSHPPSLPLPPPASRASPPPARHPSCRPGGPEVERSGGREVRCRWPPGRGIDARSPAAPGEPAPPERPSSPRNGRRSPSPRRPASPPPRVPAPSPPAPGRAPLRRAGG